jgi:hypothetical protein
MSGELTAHPLAFELRIDLNGDFHSSRVHRTLADAEAETEERRCEVMERGWMEPR